MVTETSSMSPKQDAIYHPKNQLLWYMLAMQGGIVNVGGFLELGHFVSHVTGFSGKMMIEVFNANMLSTFFFALIPIAFLTGAFVSGCMIELHRKQKSAPVYTHIMLFLSLCYLCLALLGRNNFLPTFGETAITAGNAFILALLCGACGVQNALFTKASGAVVRTTHLTGLFTDFGIGLARLCVKADVTHEKRATILRFGLITSFMLGSFVGVWFFKQFQHLAWILPASISFFVSARLYKIRVRMQQVFDND